MRKKTLAELYEDHEGKTSDKWRLYLAEYDRLLDQFREASVRLLEIGIQNGGSLEIWSKYFPFARKLVGCDINPDCARLTYDDARVSLVIGDATTDAAQKQILAHAGAFDIIIDDGSHRSSEIAKTFVMYFPHLKEGGVFIVEDLHCSYWQEFEGGLFHPFSSITFFKRLADVVNQDHWGVKKTPAELFHGFASQYGLTFADDLFLAIHSVEFINSMCVVRKNEPSRSRLGPRFVAGSLEVVKPGHLALQGNPSPTPDQSTNKWSARKLPPEEELLIRLQELSLLQKRVGELNHEVATLRASTSWRITAPLRVFGSRLARMQRALKKFDMLQRSGCAFLRRVASRKLRGYLLQRGFNFYRRCLRRNRLGRLFAAAIVKSGMVSRAELMIHALAEPPIIQGHRTIHRQWSEEQVDASVNGFHLSPPLNLVVSAALSARPHINVLLPSLRVQHMSGGPNTALLLAAGLVDLGETVRFIATDTPLEGEEEAFYLHLEELLSRPVDRSRVQLIDGFDRSKVITIGADDLFLATAWWTAQIAKYGVRRTRHEQFIYLIQDFEPILHEGSTFQALALETYALPHIPVINSRLLLDHLVQEGCGMYSRKQFADEAMFFEPAIDRTRYFPDGREKAHERNRRVLLFYARPTIARRNLFELGLVALRRAVAAGLLNPQSWDVRAMGENIGQIALGDDVYLNPLPWMSYDSYAAQIRGADLLMSLMLSPHPSYPPLEMAAAGKVAITNAFSVKTAERMHALSPNILVAAPTADDVSAALQKALARINAGMPSFDPTGSIALPASWDDSLAAVIPQLKERLNGLRRTAAERAIKIIESYSAQPKSAHEHFRIQRLGERRRKGGYHQEPGLLSLITTVYETDPTYVEELAGTIFLQDGGTNFEWLILDNGSTREKTKSALRAISRHPCVRLHSVESNLGIVGGMRYCLEHATGRYVVPTDSDDVIEPDCIHVLTDFLRGTGYPALLYTDEDKLSGDLFVTPYFKPDWDPVLFINSCYIAHLCAINRELALRLSVYTERKAEGCHDWDTFLRFMEAGYRPRHVPEVLYSWRAHDHSTSGNINSKSYISNSHRAVLQGHLSRINTPHIELTISPLFSHNVDWWFRRKRQDPASYLSVLLTEHAKELSSAGSFKALPAPPPVSISVADGINGLARIVKTTSAEFIHLRWDGVEPDDDEWYWEAIGLMELFSDTVMIGGTIHDGRQVLSGPKFFGYGDGFDCPDKRRSLSDPGHFAKMWKAHSVSGISTAHCVIRTSFLKDIIDELTCEQVSLRMLGPWLGGLAREDQKRVVFSPFMRASAVAIPEDAHSSESWAAFLSRFWHQFPEDQFFSPRFSLDPALPYTAVTTAEREQHLKGLQRRTLPYADWLPKEIRRRGRRYATPRNPPSLSLMTTVYEGTNFALLKELSNSVTHQTLRAAEWTIVAHGPIAEGLSRALDAMACEWGATVIFESGSLGIIGAMRRALDHSHGDYVIPVDADDLLTPDALQILAHEIVRLDSPDLVYSDEDALVDGKPSSPYLRPAFDPIMNLEGSYIWHLCAIKRATALKVGSYTDTGAEWCHDWDTVTRIYNAGGRIAHVPEVLYHWRKHVKSTTNRPGGNPKSLESVRHVLQKQLLRTPHPDRFAVETFPLDRGTKELYIRRKDVSLPAFLWYGDLRSVALDSLKDGAVVVVTSGEITIEDANVYSEVARLLELHPFLGAVGGRVLDNDDRIVEGCFVLNHKGGIECPWQGRDAKDGGPYALALKPQTVHEVGPSLAFFRVKALLEIGSKLPCDAAPLGPWMSEVCANMNNNNWRIAFSPLIYGHTTKSDSAISKVGQHDDASVQSMNYAMARYGNTCPHLSHW